MALTTLKKKSFENTVGKGENVGNQHFLLFPQCFLPFPKQISIFLSHLFCHLQELMLSASTSLKFCHLVKSLVPFDFAVNSIDQDQNMQNTFLYRLFTFDTDDF